MVDINNLEGMLESGQDTALLRFTLGNVFIRKDKYEQAIKHLARAVELDPGYSAAWKAYGRALAGLGRMQEAEAVYRKGIAIAHEKGDKQAAKEMEVFLRRLEK
ncbi:MAG: tetratricopeptide repeat protein [Gammaproteobacteria bacterium]|jgi:Flp pilus assembly protein TadD